MLTSVVFARNIGKFRLAQHIVEELLCEPPDPSLIVRALIFGASTYRDRGGYDAALVFANHAEYLVDSTQLIVINLRNPYAGSEFMESLSVELDDVVLREHRVSP